MRTRPLFLTLLILFLGFQAQAEMLLLSQLGKFLLKPIQSNSTRAEYQADIYDCIDSTPNVLLKERPDHYCKKLLTFWDSQEEEKLSNLLKAGEYEPLERELIRTREGHAIDSLPNVALLAVLSKELEVWDMKKEPLLTQVTARFLGIERALPPTKTGAFSANFKYARDIKLSTDGKTLHYIVGDTIYALDLWSGEGTFRFEVPDFPGSAQLCEDDIPDRPRFVNDYAFSPDGRYLVVVAKNLNGPKQTYTIVFDRVEDEIIQDFALKKPVNKVIGFSDDGETVIMQWDIGHAQTEHTFSFGALCDAKQVPVEEPRIEGALRAAIWGKSPEQRQRENTLLAALEGEFDLKTSEDSDHQRREVSFDRSTILVWNRNEGLYRVIRAQLDQPR